MKWIHYCFSLPSVGGGAHYHTHTEILLFSVCCFSLLFLTIFSLFYSILLCSYIMPIYSWTMCVGFFYIININKQKKMEQFVHCEQYASLLTVTVMTWYYIRIMPCIPKIFYDRINDFFDDLCVHRTLCACMMWASPRYMTSSIKSDEIYDACSNGYINWGKPCSYIKFSTIYLFVHRGNYCICHVWCLQNKTLLWLQNRRRSSVMRNMIYFVMLDWFKSYSIFAHRISDVRRWKRSTNPLLFDERKFRQWMCHCSDYGHANLLNGRRFTLSLQWVNSYVYANITQRWTYQWYFISTIINDIKHSNWNSLL